MKKKLKPLLQMLLIQLINKLKTQKKKINQKILNKKRKMKTNLRIKDKAVKNKIQKTIIEDNNMNTM